MSVALEVMAPVLRVMSGTDVDGVMGLEERVYPFPWTAQIFHDCLRVGYHCWVWSEADTVIGYGIMSTGAGEAHILNICTDPRHQRRGLGRRMLDHLLMIAGSEKVDTVFLEVRPSNVAALALYEQIGFNEIGRRKGYYPAEDGREDALVLAMALNDDEFAKAFE